MLATVEQTSRFGKHIFGKSLARVRKAIRVISSLVTRYGAVFAKGDYCLPKFSGIVGCVDEPQWERLGRYVKQRRLSRGWSQAMVRKHGGPSDTLQSQIESGDWRPSRGVNETLGKIDEGMQWQPGSASAVLAGGDPTLLTPERVDIAVTGNAPADAKEHQQTDFALAIREAQLLWESIGDMAEAVLRTGSPDERLREAARRLVVTGRDVIPDLVLGTPAASSSRELLQRIFSQGGNLLGSLDESEPSAWSELSAADEIDAVAEAAIAELNVDCGRNGGKEVGRP